ISNACIVANGGVDVTVDDGEIEYVSEYDAHGSSGNVDPTPIHMEPQEISFISEPVCDSLVLPKVKNGGTINPGHYPSITVNNKDLIMSPGLYCVDGDFKATGGIISVSGDNRDGVTIYIKNGNFTVSGNVTVNLRAPMDDKDDEVFIPQGVPPAVRGLLIYLAEDNFGQASILGNATSSYRGTIFAPDGTIEVGGSGSTVSDLYSQFVANTVVVHGTADMQVTFDEDMITTQDPSLSLYK
ncbi:MAG: hypothetical protein MUO76_16090, partial [Anaerolineaceae bacterium]|nr:hypothetical protein [Anaerolineaceae bacterium]